MPKTRKKPWWSGWRGKSPNQKQRRAMRRRCGKKCFLGPNLSFPICAKGTCRRNKRGIMSAYIRAKQWGKPKSFYKNYWGKPHMKRKVYTRVAKKARKLMGWKKGGRRRRTKRRRRRITRRRRGGMNPIGNTNSSWSILPENGEENGEENENTVEIHNVEDPSGKSMQKQAGKAGVIEGGNTATLKHGLPKTRKRPRSAPWGGMKVKPATKKKNIEKLKKQGYYPTTKKGMKVWIKKKYKKPIPYENPETVENIGDFFN